MKESNYMWIENTYLGGNILYSNYKSNNYNIIFSGAERIESSEDWKIHFNFNNTCTYCGNIIAVCRPEGILRFENYLGVYKDIYIKNEYGEKEIYNKFFKVKFIKLINIETDFISYELHCY